MGKPGRGSDRRSTADTPATASLDRLAEDWITLWQTELAGLAADPDWIAASQHAMAVGAAWLRMIGAIATPPAGAAAGDAAAAAPPRPAPAAAAPGDGDAAGLGGARDGGDGHAGSDTEAMLRRRLAELEQRLATLERGPRRGRADRPSPRRRRPSA